MCCRGSVHRRWWSALSEQRKCEIAPARASPGTATVCRSLGYAAVRPIAPTPASSCFEPFHICRAPHGIQYAEAVSTNVTISRVRRRRCGIRPDRDGPILHVSDCCHVTVAREISIRDRMRLALFHFFPVFSARYGNWPSHSTNWVFSHRPPAFLARRRNRFRHASQCAPVLPEGMPNFTNPVGGASAR